VFIRGLCVNQRLMLYYWIVFQLAFNVNWHGLREVSRVYEKPGGINHTADCKGISLITLCRMVHRPDGRQIRRATGISVTDFRALSAPESLKLWG
jgi:hypothetical protein